MKETKKQHWLVDLSLIVIIIVMGVFAFLELSRTITFIRQQRMSSSTQQAEQLPETELSEAEPGLIMDIAGINDEAQLALSSLQGDHVALADFSGTPLLVNFWATWCPPCLEEMPLIQAYAQRFDDQLIVLAINAGEEEAVVREFVRQNQLDLNFLLDPSNSAAREFRVYGFPTTLFFDETGEVKARHIGVLNESLLERYLLQIGIGE